MFNNGQVQSQTDFRELGDDDRSGQRREHCFVPGLRVDLRSRRQRRRGGYYTDGNGPLQHRRDLRSEAALVMPSRLIQ